MDLDTEPLLDQAQMTLRVAVEFSRGQVVVKSDDFSRSGGCVAQ
jgi:hypothetical protein